MVVSLSGDIDRGRGAFSAEHGNGRIRLPAAVVLSDRSIREEIEGGRIVIEPFDEDLVQPSSVDVRVDSSFRVFHNSRYPYIDVRQPMDDLTELVVKEGDEPFILHPGEFVLGQTLERVNVANLPITIYYGMPIGQISFMRMDQPVEHPYGSGQKASKYQGQDEPTPSRFYLNFDRR